jgi:transposase-like protein
MTTVMVADTQEGDDGEDAGAVAAPVSGIRAARAARRAAAREGLSELVDEAWLDQAVAQLRSDGARLTGPGGFLSGLIKQVLERGLQAELSEHLGYKRHEVDGRGSGNSRNGFTPKTINTEVGPVDVDVPRDRAGTFTPLLLPKHARSMGGFSDIIISLYAGGMTVRDIGHHLQRVYGTELSHDTISTITDSVLEEVKAWQSRPLDEGRFLSVVAN